MMPHRESAADRYAARVDAVLAQRTRLRGPQPPGDPRAGCPADHPLVTADPLRQLGPNLEVIASYIEADDVIIDVGGGAGRISLPLALRCREVINVEPSPTMRMGFRRNAAGAGISNARIIEGEWPKVDAPAGSVALVNHVTYLTREIVPFIKKLEQAGRRRVLITVNSVPGPSLQRVLYKLVHGEAEEVVPGHVELINVIWELGILPDIQVSPFPTVRRRSRVPSRGFRESSGVGGVWGRTSKPGSARSSRRASTNSFPSAPRASSRVMLRLVEKF
jgi:hypothetical protein